VTIPSEPFRIPYKETVEPASKLPAIELKVSVVIAAVFDQRPAPIAFRTPVALFSVTLSIEIDLFVEPV